jgi:hypothetical protein
VDKKIKRRIGGCIVASAIIWAGVIVSCSVVLKGTACYESIQSILYGGIISHFIVLYFPLSYLFKKDEE